MFYLYFTLLALGILFTRYFRRSEIPRKGEYAVAANSSWDWFIQQLDGAGCTLAQKSCSLIEVIKTLNGITAMTCDPVGQAAGRNLELSTPLDIPSAGTTYDALARECAKRYTFLPRTHPIIQKMHGDLLGVCLALVRQYVYVPRVWPWRLDAGTGKRNKNGPVAILFGGEIEAAIGTIMHSMPPFTYS